MNRVHLGVVTAALLALGGVVACALTHTPIPDALAGASTTALGALAGIAMPGGRPDATTKEGTDGQETPHP